MCDTMSPGMRAPVRCVVTPTSAASFRAHFFARGPGWCFVVHDDRERGTPASIVLAVGGRRLELEGEVDRADFDEAGQEGLLVALDPRSAQALAEFAPLALQVLEEPETLRPSSHDREPTLSEGTLVDDRFRIEAHVASGRLGDVYRAAHLRLERTVAFKLLRRSLGRDPERWLQVEREAELVSHLDSAHVARTVEVGRTRGDAVPFLATEFVAGRTFQQELAAGPFAPRRAIELLGQVCEGLGEAHALGVLHRDLKLANLMLARRRDGTEVAKIVEFGIARLVESGQDLRLNRVPAPGSLAPEQILARELDQRTDVYAMGCVAYELLTGSPPFVADDLPRLISKHLNAKPKPLEALRADLAHLPSLCDAVLKALEKEPDQRFPTAQAFAAALDADAGWADDVPTARMLRTVANTPGMVPAVSPLELPTEPMRPAAVRPEPPTPVPPPPRTGTTGKVATGSQKTAAVESGKKGSGSAPAVRPPEPVLPAELTLTPQPVDPVAPAPVVAAPAAKKSESGRARALKVEEVVDDGVAERLRSAREAVDDSVRRGVFAWVEVLGASGQGELAKACFGAVLEVLAAYGGFVDATTAEGTLVAFTSEQWLPAGRAALALLAMRDAVIDQGARLGVGVNVRAGLVSAELRHGQAPLAAEALEQARQLVSRFQPGHLVAQRALVADLGQFVETASTWSADLVQLTRRQPVSVPPVELVGRATVLELVEQRQRRLAAEGLSGALVLEGVSRAGRTAVALEIVARAKRHAVVPLGLMAFPGWKRQPNSLVTALVCALCEVPMDLRVARLRPALEALKLGPTLVEAASLATGLVQSSWPLTTGQVVHVMRSVLRARVSQRPVVVVIDGVEHLDEASLLVLGELLRHPAEGELTVALGAPAALRRFEGVVTASLEPLDDEGVTAIVRSALSVKPGPKLLAALRENARGLPGLVHDWLWVLQTRGALIANGAVAELIDDVPVLGPDEVVRARVELLPPDVARVLEAAWCQGETFEAATVVKTWPRVTQEALQKASQQRLVQPSYARRWSMASPSLQQAVAGCVSVERPAMYQRLVAALAEHGKTGPVTPIDPLVIGRLLLAQGDGPRAVGVFQQAVELALTRRAPRDAAAAWKGLADALALKARVMKSARNSLEQDLETLGQTLKQLDCLSRAASCCLVVLEVAAARAFIDEALVVAAPIQRDTTELLLALTHVYRAEGRRTEATEALEQAELSAPGTPVEALVLIERGELAEHEGRVDDALVAFHAAMACADAAIEVARWHGEVDLKARLEGRLGALVLQKKDPSTARRLFDSSAHRWRMARWPPAEARALLNLAAAHGVARDLSAAARWFGSAADAANRGGDLLLAARALVLQAKNLAKNGSTTEAKQAATEAHRLATLVGWEQGSSEALALLG